MAHSLGGHIMSNYIYDMQKPGSLAAVDISDFQQMKTHVGMITFGCNIPFFALAYKKADIVPINFPGDALTPGQKAKAKWLNYFDPDDVLGYPLKAINSAYDNVVDQDNSINVGGLLSNWNPLAHQNYWTDKDFTRSVASFIATFL